MKVLVVGRTYPTKLTGSVGLFEYEQAYALSKDVNTKYLFIDNQSIKKHRNIKYFSQIDDQLEIKGKYLPIGGLPENIYSKIKTRLFKKVFNQMYENEDYPDVVHFHFPLLTSNREILDFLINKNIKIVVTEHWTKIMNKQINEKELIELKYIYDSCKFISVSEDLTLAIKQLLNLANHEINTIPNYVNDNMFFIDNDIKKQKNHIVSIGRLTDIKNNQFLLQSLYNCAQEPISLSIVGSGPDRVNLYNYIKNYEMNNVEIIDYMNKEELRSELNKSILYVTTSLKETFGVPVVEAWLCGTPVLIPKSHPLSMYVNKSNGLVFDDNNLVDLKNKLAEGVSKEWDELSIRQQALSSFSKDIVIENIKKVYRGI